RVVAAARQPHADPAALGSELGGVVQQVVEHLHQAHAVAFHHQRNIGDVHHQFVAARLHGRRQRLDTFGYHLPQVDRLTFEIDLAADDAADVEQVIDQPTQVRNLTFEDVTGAAHLFGGG